jgi:hypothetical protein
LSLKDIAPDQDLPYLGRNRWNALKLELPKLYGELGLLLPF